jgi:thioredoxin 1
LILTDNDFDNVIAENKIVLVDFWAEWCGPCKKLSPILDEISQEKDLLVAKINIDENNIKPKDYGVASIPTMILFKDGQPVAKIIGAQPKHVLLKKLADFI